MSQIKLLLRESLRFTSWGEPKTQAVTTSSGIISYIIGGFIQGLCLALIYALGSILFSSLVACILVVIGGVLLNRGFFYSGLERVWDESLRTWVIGASSAALVMLILFLFAKSQFLRIISDEDVYYVLFIMPAIARWSVLYPAFSYSEKKEEKEEAKDRELFGYALSQKIILIMTIVVAIVSVLTISLYGVALMFFIFLLTDAIMRLLKDKASLIREDIYKFLVEVNELFILALVYIFFTLF